MICSKCQESMLHNFFCPCSYIQSARNKVLILYTLIIKFCEKLGYPLGPKGLTEISSEPHQNIRIQVVDNCEMKILFYGIYSIKQYLLLNLDLSCYICIYKLVLRKIRSGSKLFQKQMVKSKTTIRKRCYLKYNYAVSSLPPKNKQTKTMCGYVTAWVPHHKKGLSQPKSIKQCVSDFLTEPRLQSQLKFLRYCLGKTHGTQRKLSG